MKLIIRNVQSYWEAENYRFFDSAGGKVCMHKTDEDCCRFEDFLTQLVQKPEDISSFEMKTRIQDGWVNVVDALSMSVKRVYYSTDSLEFAKRGITDSVERYDRHLEKLVSVYNNFDGPVYLTEEKGDVCHLSLQRGRRLCFYRGTFYAHLFHGQIHALDLLSQQVTVFPLKPNETVLSALNYAEHD